MRSYCYVFCVFLAVFAYLFEIQLDKANLIDYIKSKRKENEYEFFYICEYLEITPKEFFDTDTVNPMMISELTEAVKGVSSDRLRA